MKSIIAFTCIALLTACGGTKPVKNNSLDENITFVHAQIGNEIKNIEASRKVLNPVTLKSDSSVYYCDYKKPRTQSMGQRPRRGDCTSGQHLLRGTLYLFWNRPHGGQ